MLVVPSTGSNVGVKRVFGRWPRRWSRRWFRGWEVVAAGSLVLFVVYALQFSFGEFRLAATEAEGWSQTSLSAIFAVYVALYSGLSALSGLATDRWGPRVTVATGSFLLCGGYLLMASAGSLVVVVIALAVIAPIGMSCSWVPVNATAVRWFVRRRGIASAIVTSGGSVGNIVGPPLAAALIVSTGWRSALSIMAAGGLVLLLVAAALLVRSPEAVGLHPDGLDEAPLGSIDDDDRSTAQASRSGPFWLMLTMYSLSFVVLFIPFVHGSAFAVGLGVSRITAATVISSIGIGGLCGRLLVGWLSDRTDRRRAIVVALGLEVVAFTGLALAQGLTLLYPAAVAFGFGYGGSVAVFPALVADYFGRTNAGAIVGRMFALAGATAAIGPYVAALIFDASGSYRAAFAIAAGCNAAALVLALALPRPPVRTPTVVSAAGSGSSA